MMLAIEFFLAARETAEIKADPDALRALAEARQSVITGALLETPRRVGKPVGAELTGIYSARLARERRILYEIDDEKHAVIILDIRHRTTAYRRR
ncbi:MAG TPA: type II toxin-antitoxin system RelE/ParE family toxin [Jiangellaceae bacterium]|jgi:mRNA interferase RelE/StbE|nr:type II toxin-antitoxin system RelE/ParE family toxin [Jiangellaceae bacterium]